MLGINVAGTIGAYTNMMKLQMKWENKKDSGTYTEKSDEQKDPTTRMLDELKEQNENRDYSMEAIRNKLVSGKKLTFEELKYLEEKDPAAYQKAKEIQDAQEGFENALKNCRTKEDVQHVKLLHLGAAMTAVNAADHDPNIPAGQKLAIILQENAKMKAIEKVEKAFVESGAYAQLPSEAELKEKIKEEQEELKEKTEGAGKKETSETRAENEASEGSAKAEGAAGADDIPENKEFEKNTAADNKVQKSQASETRTAQAEGSPSKETQRRMQRASRRRALDAYQKTVSDNLPEREKEKLRKKA